MPGTVLQSKPNFNPILTLLPGGRIQNVKREGFLCNVRGKSWKATTKTGKLWFGKVLSKAIAVGDASVSMFRQPYGDPLPSLQRVPSLDRHCTHRSAAQPHSQLTDGAAGGCSKATLITEH